MRNVHADNSDIVGIAEIAELAGVKASAVVNWRVRRDDFPAPVAELRSGPVFSRPAVRKWLKRNRKETMAHVISTINLKGGVGKTTVTVGIAEMLVHEHHQNVQYGLDPNRLAMKWKSPERLTDHIVGFVKARSEKGSAFKG